MNTRQRVTIFIGLLIVAAMLIFPPMMRWGGSVGCQSDGYGFLFNPRSTYIAALDTQNTTKNVDYDHNGWCRWKINQEVLKYEIIIAVILTVGIALLLGKRKQLD